MRRYLEDGKAVLPANALLHLVASRYGQAPDDVRGWAFDDYRDAVTYLPLTTPRAKR